MKRITLSLAGILFAGLWFAGVGAAGSEEVPRIGYLTLSPLLEPPSPERAGFLKGLREHGYEDGKNIIIEYRSAEGDPEALPFIAEELVATGVRLVVTAGYPAVKAVQEASNTMPIVLLFAADPDATGFAKSLARPGGNITGMSMQNRELGAKRLELLKEAIPTIQRVAVLWDSANPVLKPEWESTLAAAQRLGIQLISADGAGEADFEKAFALIAKERPDALVTFVDLRLASYRNIIPEFALQQRLPSIFALKAFVESGGLMSYSPDFVDLCRRSAGYVDKVLKGAKPAELPIQQPTRYVLVINLKTTQRLGLKLPERTLQRADEVIQPAP
jgi:putative ABC transport system substrate-binding protein